MTYQRNETPEPLAAATMSPTDRELTERAARAIGLLIAWEPVHNCHWISFGQGIQVDPWTPLDDDAQAFRLAAKLGITVQPVIVTAQPIMSFVECSIYSTIRGTAFREGDFSAFDEPVHEFLNKDPAAAARRAIVTAASRMEPRA